VHKLLSALDISSRECSHREHVQGKAFVLAVALKPSEVERFCRQRNRTVDIALPKRAVANSSSDVTDVLFFIGCAKEL
jgi:hypothetical protein